MENTNLVPEMQEENLSEQMQVRRLRWGLIRDITYRMNIS